MYPFKSDKIYLRNSWYVIAFADELDAGPIERTIMDEPVALFRMADGTPAAMWGICPHRYYPLAKGKVVGDALQCNYHGFQFDGRSGSCVKIPSQAASPKGFRQRIYPIVQHGPWLWIWPGDSAKADTALLPAAADIGIGPGWRVDNVGLLPTAGRAQLLIENLLDLTHVAFLHAVSIDGSALLTDNVKIHEEERIFKAMRSTRTPWVDGFYDLLYGSQARFDGNHETTTGSWVFSPGYITTFSGFITAIDNHASVDPDIYGTVYFHHMLTPETAGSTHYFSAISRNYRLNDEGLSEALVQMDREVRMQDVEAASAIETFLHRHPPSGPELLARADTAAIRLRRRLAAQLDAEEVQDITPAT